MNAWLLCVDSTPPTAPTQGPAGVAHGWAYLAILANPQARCGGITLDTRSGWYTGRSGSVLIASPSRETSWLVSLDLVTENDDEGARRHAHGRPDDPHDVEFEAFGSELGPGEHVVGVHGFYSGAHIYSLMFELSSGRTLGGGRVLWRGLLPPNRSPFSFHDSKYVIFSFKLFCISNLFINIVF